LVIIKIQNLVKLKKNENLLKMDFDIDRFLNETFKKVENKDKKKAVNDIAKQDKNENKKNNLIDVIEI